MDPASSTSATGPRAWLRDALRHLRSRTEAAPPTALGRVDELARPVVLPGGVALHVCGNCLTVVEDETASAAITCPCCGSEALRPQPRTRRTETPAVHSTTRVVMLSGGLDVYSLGRLLAAVRRRDDEPRRIVVLEVAPGSVMTPEAQRTLEESHAAALRVGGRVILSSPDARLRETLHEIAGIAVAATPSHAMELAAAFTPAEASFIAEQLRR